MTNGRDTLPLPRDMNGTELLVGDSVFVPATIKQITINEGSCVCNVETRNGSRLTVAGKEILKPLKS